MIQVEEFPTIKISPWKTNLGKTTVNSRISKSVRTFHFLRWRRKRCLDFLLGCRKDETDAEKLPPFAKKKIDASPLFELPRFYFRFVVVLVGLMSTYIYLDLARIFQDFPIVFTTKQTFYGYFASFPEILRPVHTNKLFWESLQMLLHTEVWHSV